MKKILWILGFIVGTVLGWIYRARIARQLDAVVRREKVLDDATSLLTQMGRHNSGAELGRLRSLYVDTIDRYQDCRREIALRHRQINKIKGRIDRAKKWSDLQ
jgi:hypothetical protein